MIIAIDGTVASGKGTLARRIARDYGLGHMDTGLLYRAVGYAALLHKVDPNDEDAVAKLTRETDLQAFDESDLRTAEAGQAASKVAVHPAVRQTLLDVQRYFANQPSGAVLDGRDIGTVVCPNADVKFWVDATLDERARRRTLELQGRGSKVTFEEMRIELAERDARDQARAAAPMKPADDAHLLDTTELTIDGALNEAKRIIALALAG